MTSSVLVASNRGPVSFSDEAGQLVAGRGGGGLVAALQGLAGTAALWVCAALSDADRRAADGATSGRLDVAGHDVGPTAVRMLAIDPVTFERAYNGVANSTLWFLSHLLYATASAPTFDSRSGREWAAYQDYNEAFAVALAEEAAPGARVLVQDYHLSLVPRLLRDRRPDLRIGHFSHTPWAPPEYFRLLPDEVAASLLRGLLGADSVGFLSPRWADAFSRCAIDVLGATRVEGGLRVDGRDIRVDVHSLGVDGADLRARAAAPDVLSRLPGLQQLIAGRQLLLRVDRTELSKNIVRGLEAYRELLRRWPEHRGRVVHLVLAYPSRHDLPEYREYTAAVQRVAHEVNEEFGSGSWLPVHLEVRDDYARSLAAYQLADVLIVNPVRDGMNLVAKEGPVLSPAGVALVLSREAGAADQLSADALMVNPFDVSATAHALHHALTMGAAERAARSARLAGRATELPPTEWFAAQLAALPAD